jgi:hypothetical protein
LTPTFVTGLRIALFTDAHCLSLGLCLKAQSPLLLTPTFVTGLRIALFTDAHCLSLGLCLKAQSPLLLTPTFCNDPLKAKGSNGALEADERNFDQGAERISTQVEYLIRFEQPMRSLMQPQQLQKRQNYTRFLLALLLFQGCRHLQHMSHLCL